MRSITALYLALAAIFSPASDVPGGALFFADAAAPVLAKTNNRTLLHFYYSSPNPADVPSPIGDGITVTEPDNDNIAKATVQIMSNYGGGHHVLDIIYFVNTGSISGAFDATSGSLTLSGAATAANYQTALESLTFRPSSTYSITDTPSEHTRVFQFNVEDAGGSTSNSVSRYMTIQTAKRVCTDVDPCTVVLTG